MKHTRKSEPDVFDGVAIGAEPLQLIRTDDGMDCYYFEVPAGVARGVVPLHRSRSSLCKGDDRGVL